MQRPQCTAYCMLDAVRDGRSVPVLVRTKLEFKFIHFRGLFDQSQDITYIGAAEQQC